MGERGVGADRDRHVVVGMHGGGADIGRDGHDLGAKPYGTQLDGEMGDHLPALAHHMTPGMAGLKEAAATKIGGKAPRQQSADRFLIGDCEHMFRN